MIYDIRLTIATDYAASAATGRHVVCVMPRDLGPGQRLIAGLLSVDPATTLRHDRTDFFGNPVVEFAVDTPHQGIAVQVQARVVRAAMPVASHDAVPLDSLRGVLAGWRDMGPDSPLHFTAATARVPRDAAMTAFARSLLRPGMTALDATLVIGHALHGTMRFDATATTVDTPAPEAFAKRHGVCQDFSHIMIACLRGIGVPAAYVSGYLRTQPPPGKRRLEGADAMHAWVRAWCGPQAGWVDFDPTNDRTCDASHITVAHGRDYDDVPPIRGILRGAGGQRSRQAVDVIPVGDHA
ncbi:Transglutaminase-like enzyme, putative cysteine protease [Loktanella fryxellensis]|uniref:Transglutaminase-like enzyme, putative cysteine protease n=1 Tax=Loktanella fryxellensis TaxID=245187 RepID=A0A1H8G653_9RHOB|nr:transglutaminase family protein [Loktanella fryxellensis]SEN39506.1 Transglutaminase-like enzyme, putative cysteine protease [Loktanella fryxellensis]